MENKVRYATLTAVIAVAAGLFGAYGMSDVMSQTFTNTADTSAYMLGHVAYIHKDASGNVIGYQQTDNIIVNQGEDCVLAKMFAASTTGVGNCEPSDTTGVYTIIGIGNGTGSGFDPTADNADTGLGQEMNAAGLTRTGAEDVTLTASSGDTEARAVISEEFTNSSPNSQEISESGLFNTTSTTTDGMFAKQIFSNNVTLANGESLTVEWTINVGGTGSFN